MTHAGGTYVVTGAASGIGSALVAQLSSAGAQVIGLDRNATGSIVACDLADPSSIATALDAFPDHIAGLANVAGVPGTASAESVLLVNVLGPRLLTDALEERLSKGSAVVNVASVAAHRNTQPREALLELAAARDREGIRRWLADHPIDGPAAYDTSKKVLVDSTPLTAARLLSRGVRCLSVSPGPVETPILGDFAASMGQGSMDRSVAAVGRHGRPEEVAAVVAFALSPAASWLNGIDIPVEGGLLAIRTAATSRHAKDPT